MKYQICKIDLNKCEPPKQGTCYIIEKLENQSDNNWGGLVVTETYIFKSLKKAEFYLNKLIKAVK